MVEEISRMVRGCIEVRLVGLLAPEEEEPHGDDRGHNDSNASDDAAYDSTNGGA